MRYILLLSFLFFCALRPGLAQAPVFTMKDNMLRVQTSRYSAIFADGCLISLTNNLTKEIYSAPSPELEKRLPTMMHGIGVYPADISPQVKAQVDEMHKWLGGYNANTQWSYLYHPTSRSRLSMIQRTPNSAIVSWTGLQAYNPERFVPEATYSLELEVRAGSGDLVITARGDHAGAGTMAIGFAMANFSRDLDFISTICEGSHNQPKNMSLGNSVATWPMPWNASLVIAEGQKGSVGMWMADAQMRPRYLHTRNNADGYDVIFESNNEMPFAGHTDIESRRMIINVYNGSWVLPAKAFRAWWAATFKVQPLEKRNPEWLRNVRWAVSWPSVPPKELGAKTIFMAPQVWKVGPKEGPNVDGGLFPEDMEAGPVLNKWDNLLKSLFDAGNHPMVYLNINLMNCGHPWAAKYWDYRIYRMLNPEPWVANAIKSPPPKPGDPYAFQVHCAAKPWQDLIVGWAKQTYDKYGIAGFYMDCAAGTEIGHNGLIDGKNDVQGQVELMQRIKATVPGAFLDCEFLNEANATVVDFGSMGYDTWWPGSGPGRQKTVHPIIGCLFNDYVYTHYISPPTLPAFDETVGRITRWGYEALPAGSVTDYSQLEDFPTFRARLMCETLMKPVYPEKWDRSVHAYYADPQGNSYLIVGDNPDEGRMVKRAKDGKESLVYWRIKGRDHAQLTATTGIDGWVAYAGDTAIGLNPAADYLYVSKPRNMDWQVTKLPDGVFIERCRPYANGMLVLELKTKDGKPVTGEMELQTVHKIAEAVTNGGKANLLTLQANRPDINAYRVTVQAPGVVVFSVKEAKPAAADGQPTLMTADIDEHYAYLNDTGIREPIRGDRKMGVDVKNNAFTIMNPWTHHAAVDFLYRLPEPPAGKKVLLKATTLVPPGWGYRFSVRVNGTEALGFDVKGKEREAKDHVVDLTLYAGKDAAISFIFDKCYLFGWLRVERPVIAVE